LLKAMKSNSSSPWETLFGDLAGAGVQSLAKIAGVAKADSPAKAAEAKGADTVQRAESKAPMPTWVWLALAGAGAIVLIVVLKK
jgi:hypothetical protein